MKSWRCECVLPSLAKSVIFNKYIDFLADSFSLYKTWIFIYRQIVHRPVLLGHLAPRFPFFLNAGFCLGKGFTSYTVIFSKLRPHPKKRKFYPSEIKVLLFPCQKLINSRILFVFHLSQIQLWNRNTRQWIFYDFIHWSWNGPVNWLRYWTKVFALTCHIHTLQFADQSDIERRHPGHSPRNCFHCEIALVSGTGVRGL